jgi:glycosyltransferase involved in cell wall biosynthesis
MQTISVIVPCYNMSMFLDEAVASILAQNHDELEILIVDDGSTDDTAERVKQLPGPVRYLRQDNGGPAVARNRGLDAARHDLIAFLDADDLWPPDKLSIQLAELQADSSLDFVLGNQRHFGVRPGAPAASRDYDFDSAHFIFLLGCGLFRRRVFEKVGGFDESMRYSEDTDWFFRAREASAPYKLMPDVTVFYRRHERSMTHGRGALEKGFLAAIKKSLDRRRTTGRGELAWMYGSQFSPKPRRSEGNGAAGQGNPEDGSSSES